MQESEELRFSPTAIRWAGRPPIGQAEPVGSYNVGLPFAQEAVATKDEPAPPPEYTEEELHLAALTRDMRHRTERRRRATEQLRGLRLNALLPLLHPGDEKI